MSLFQWYNNIF